MHGNSFLKNLSLILILSLIITSCNQDINTETKTCSEPLYPQKIIKMYKDSRLIDTLMFLVPFDDVDSIRYINVDWHDSIDIEIQKNIYKINYINREIYTNKKRDTYWFTSLNNKTKSIRNFTLYNVNRDNIAIEKYKIRYYNKGEILELTNIP